MGLLTIILDPNIANWIYTGISQLIGGQFEKRMNSKKAIAQEGAKK